VFCASVAPLELILIKPSTPHVAGIQLPIHTHNLLIAYRGHVNPERNKKTTDENTTMSIDDSLSVTTCCKIIPKKIDENMSGTMNKK
jgi:hypothetical protein